MEDDFLAFLRDDPALYAEAVPEARPVDLSPVSFELALGAFNTTPALVDDAYSSSGESALPSPDDLIGSVGFISPCDLLLPTPSFNDDAAHYYPGVDLKTDFAPYEASLPQAAYPLTAAPLSPIFGVDQDPDPLPVADARAASPLDAVVKLEDEHVILKDAPAEVDDADDDDAFKMETDDDDDGEAYEPVKSAKGRRPVKARGQRKEGKAAACASPKPKSRAPAKGRRASKVKQESSEDDENDDAAARKRRRDRKSQAALAKQRREALANAEAAADAAEQRLEGLQKKRRAACTKIDAVRRRLALLEARLFQ